MPRRACAPAPNLRARVSVGWASEEVRLPREGDDPSDTGGAPPSPPRGEHAAGFVLTPPHERAVEGRRNALSSLRRRHDGQRQQTSPRGRARRRSPASDAAANPVGSRQMFGETSAPSPRGRAPSTRGGHACVPTTFALTRRHTVFDYLRIMINARLAKMDERGASAVEYGLLVAGIAAVIVAVVFLLGDTLSDVFNDTQQLDRERLTDALGGNAQAGRSNPHLCSRLAEPALGWPVLVPQHPRRAAPSRLCGFYAFGTALRPGLRAGAGVLGGGTPEPRPLPGNTVQKVGGASGRGHRTPALQFVVSGLDVHLHTLLRRGRDARGGSGCKRLAAVLT